MTHWIGSRAAIDAASAAAFAAYAADNPTAICGETGDEISNPTLAWATPLQDANEAWVIPAYREMATPAGCRETGAVDWPAEPE